MVYLGIDALGAKHGGAAIVAQAVVSAALRRADVEKLTVFCSLAHLRRFAWPAHPKLEVIEPGYPDTSSPARMAWPLVGLSHAVGNAGIDRLLCLSNAGIGPSQVPTTVMVQQPTPYSPEARRCYGPNARVRIAASHWATKQSLRRADAVIVQTPTMRAMVEQDIGLPERPIHIVPHDPGPSEWEPLLARDPWRILYVGSNTAYKNLGCLAAAVRSLSEQFSAVHVACTLQPDDPMLQDSRWSALGYIGTEELKRQYQRAGVLVLPSFTETVGLPLLEAMRFGLPVVVADRPYAHDVCGPCALFFEPTRPESLASVLRRLWSDPAATAARVAAGVERVNAFHARRGYDVIVSLALGCSS